jgi:hypothetical protein
MQARYVIGRDGIIVYADINADYRQHPDPCEIVPLLCEMSRTPWLNSKSRGSVAKVVGEEIYERAGGRVYGIAVGIDTVRLDGSHSRTPDRLRHAARSRSATALAAIMTAEVSAQS